MDMSIAINHDIAGRLDEVAGTLRHQGANHFRVEAYHHASTTLRAMGEPIPALFAREGMAGLEKLPGIGTSIARSIRDIILHGKLGMLERLRSGSDPLHLLTTVPGIGDVLAANLHDELGIETLEELEAAAHDGRLETLSAIGAKRLAGIRDTLAHRLGRVRPPPLAVSAESEPPVAELLDVDAEYRREAAADRLKKIAPRRFNPAGEAWLPILHTTRGPRHYTALFSNTAHAHEVGKTRDWVVLYCEELGHERRWTVLTAEFGRLRGHRIVGGREDECRDFMLASR